MRQHIEQLPVIVGLGVSRIQSNAYQAILFLNVFGER